MAVDSRFASSFEEFFARDSQSIYANSFMHTRELLRGTLEDFRRMWRSVFACVENHWTVASELKKLRQRLRHSLVDVERSLSLGWIGVRDIVSDKYLFGIHCDPMELWQAYYPLLLQHKRLLLGLAKLLKFWVELLSLLLLLTSRFSEFPNHLRPPCTTMPWTIWPALVVLWGVCWMFYEMFNPDWESGLFEDQDPIGPVEEFGSILLRSDCNASLSLSELLELEQQLQQSEPDLAAPQDSLPALLATYSRDAIDPLAFTGAIPGTMASTTLVAQHQTIGTTQEATEGHQSVSPHSATLVKRNALLVQEQPSNISSSPTSENHPTKASQNSRHSQTEQYFCPYPDCKRSKPGTGFRRKDNLDQHLRGVHKHASVTRIRSRPAATSRSHTPATVTEPAPTPLQSKKRKRESDTEEEVKNKSEQVDRIGQELAEERRLRERAEEENRRLQQKLERYEERMEKYEERLDRMMTLLEERRSEEARKG